MLSYMQELTISSISGNFGKKFEVGCMIKRKKSILSNVGYWVGIGIFLITNKVQANAIVHVVGGTSEQGSFYTTMDTESRGSKTISCPDGYVLVGYSLDICNGNDPLLDSTVNPKSITCPSIPLAPTSGIPNRLACAKGCFNGQPMITVNHNPNNYPVISQKNNVAFIGRYYPTFYGNIKNPLGVSYPNGCPVGHYQINIGLGVTGGCINPN